MDFEETMVEQNDQQTADDTPQEELVEEVDESEPIESAIDAEEQPAEEPKQNDSQGTSEPGWIKKRIDKALAKQRAELEASYDAKLEAALAPFREQQIEQQARELVRSGAVKDLDTAKELVRYRQNQPQPTQTDTTGSQQPRNDKGQFTARQQSNQSDPATQARIEMLQHQADAIRADGGPDVIGEFRNNKDVGMKVIRGEMDFYDVARQMRAGEKKKPPAPMRSPNGANGESKSVIATMSDEQFAKFEKSISEGKRYSIR